jgi:response regulator RpfG family c-di-GMP phosphodiesterase
MIASTATPTPAVLGTVLLVDDDESLLAAMSRLLRPDGLRVLIAPGGERALELLEAEGDVIGVVVSDYQMPGMNGADLLRAVRLRWPDATRILSTGNADLTAAARTVNEGQVSRLITKPCDPEQFREVVSAGLTQYQLVLENRRLREVADEQSVRLEQWNVRLEGLVSKRTAELEQANASLQRGLLDCVRVLVGFLERRLPERASRCREAARLAGRLAERAGVAPEMVRRIQLAALVQDIGLMGLPDPVLRQRPEDLTLAARTQYEQHPIVGQGTLSGVEQLVEIATWIRHHHERWDGHGYPDRISGLSIPLPSRIIAITDGYIDAVGREGTTATRWRSAQRAAGAYDPDLVEVLAAELENRPVTPPHSGTDIRLDQLRPGHELAGPIRSIAGAVLVNVGEVLSEELLSRIQALAAAGVLAPDRVRITQPPVAG